VPCIQLQFFVSGHKEESSPILVIVPGYSTKSLYVLVAAKSSSIMDEKSIELMTTINRTTIIIYLLTITTIKSFN
jgi:hypothetical protein